MLAAIDQMESKVFVAYKLLAPGGTIVAFVRKSGTRLGIAVELVARLESEMHMTSSCFKCEMCITDSSPPRSAYAHKCRHRTAGCGERL